MEGITKTFTVKGTKGISARVTVTETYDIAANASTLSVAVAVACSNYYGHTYYLNGTISAAGKTLQTMRSSSGSHLVSVNKKDTYYPIRGSGAPGSPWTTAAIVHNTDGTKSVTVAVDFKGYERNGNGANGFSVSGSKTVELTHIPRASTVGATDANIGAVSMIAVSRKSTGYTHSLAFSFGTFSGFLSESGGILDAEQKFTATSIPFAIPESFYAAIPDAPSAKCTLTCATYMGEAQIGQTQTGSFTVTAPKEQCAPMVTAQVTDTNDAAIALTGDSSVLIRYASQALCSITAEPRFGASITETTVDGAAVEGALIRPAAECYTFAAADSRGYKTSVTVTPVCIPYVPLTCRASAKRDDPTSGRATLTLSGVCYQGSFGAAENRLTLRCRVGGGDWLELTPTFDGHAYTAVGALTGLDYTRRHTITVEAADCLNTVTAAAAVEKGIPIFDWGEQDFRFHVPVHPLGGLSGYVPESRTVCGKPLSGDITLTPADVGVTPDAQSGEFPGCYYREVQGELEWLNPPMAADTEYRTTMRFGGKPVYTKRIRVTGLPKNGTANIPVGVAGADIIGCRNAIHTDNGYMVQSPYFTAAGALLIKHLFTSGNLQISTASDYSGAVGDFTVFYVKEEESG